MVHPFLLNIVIALHCEAKPIIEHLRLKKVVVSDLPFSIFANKEKTIYLIISGVGKVKSASATTFLYQWTGSHKYSCFLNIGIAGSSQFQIGDCVAVNKIVEHATQRAWYPFVGFLKNYQQAALTTHENAQTTYSAEGIMDMEGAAFFQVATLFVAHEHIQVIKIISDIDENSQAKLNEKNVSELVEKNLPMIVEIIGSLVNLSANEKAMAALLDVTDFENKWHFTHAQLLQLKETLRRWRLQLPEENPYLISKNEKKSENVIRLLQQRLDNYAHSIS